MHMHLLTVVLCVVTALEQRDVLSTSTHSARKEPKGSGEEGWSETLHPAGSLSGLASSSVNIKMTANSVDPLLKQDEITIPSSLMEEQTKVDWAALIAEYKVQPTDPCGGKACAGEELGDHLLKRATEFCQAVTIPALQEYELPKWLAGIAQVDGGAKLVYGLDMDKDATLTADEITYVGTKVTTASEEGPGKGKYEVKADTPCGVIGPCSSAMDRGNQAIGCPNCWYTLAKINPPSGATDIETFQSVTIPALVTGEEGSLPPWLVGSGSYGGKNTFVYGVDQNFNKVLDKQEIKMIAAWKGVSKPATAGAFEVKGDTPCGPMPCGNSGMEMGWYSMDPSSAIAAAADVRKSPTVKDTPGTYTFQTPFKVSIRALKEYHLPKWLAGLAKVGGRNTFVYGLDLDKNGELDAEEVSRYGIEENGGSGVYQVQADTPCGAVLCGHASIGMPLGQYKLGNSKDVLKAISEVKSLQSVTVPGLLTGEQGSLPQWHAAKGTAYWANKFLYGIDMDGNGVFAPDEFYFYGMKKPN